VVPNYQVNSGFLAARKRPQWVMTQRATFTPSA
jgi:hypothetical protein